MIQKSSNLKKNKQGEAGQSPQMDFIALTAHQLKKPLSEIKLSLQMLLDGDFGEITKEQKNFIERILERNETLICLVGDLLDMYQIGDKKTPYRLIPVDVEDLIASILIFEQDEVKKKKINLRFEKPGQKNKKVMLDREKMRIALQNIIDNAVKYTKEGGNIKITLDSGQKELKIKIEDSGIGIPEDQKEKIFTKFFRGANVIRVNAAGSGLGLFIAKNIIEAHRGKIWFESNENQGSAFSVSLPIE